MVGMVDELKTPIVNSSGAAGSSGVAQNAAATYAAARLLVGSATGDTLYVFGRTTQSDGGQGLFTWVAGGTTTVDEGYVLQATGGTWQRLDPSPTTGETLLNAVWFNIKPTNADTVNDAGFAKLKAQMRTSATTTWRVFFPPGAYTYTNNRWLWGVQKVIIDAYDCTFLNTIVGGQESPLFVGNAIEDSGDVPYPPANWANGYLFNTAAAGAISITTTTHADAGNFTPGTRVLLAGYDQQGSGFPPNLRYFEYKTVLTAVAGTGVVTFTTPLQQFYDSRWWDTTYPDGDLLAHGAPRILSLDRPNYTMPRLLWLKGATILPSATAPANSVVDLASELTILEDVTAPSFNSEYAGTLMINRCKFSARGATGDKVVDKLIIQDSLIDGNANGSGFALSDCVAINSVSLIRSRFIGVIGFTAPRSLSVSDCDIVPIAGAFSGIGTYAGVYPVRTVRVDNTRIYNTVGISYGFSNVGSPGNSLTVGTVTGTDIRIPFDTTGKNVAYGIDYGMTITNTVTGNSGIITAIYYETGSPGNLRIAGTWSTPAPGNVFRFYDAMQISDGGGNVIVGAQVPFWRGPPGPSGASGLTLPGAVSVGLLALPSVIPGTLNNYIQQQPSSDGLEFFTGASRRAQLSSYGFALYAGEQLLLTGGGGTSAIGTATLVGGTVVVSTTLVTASSRIFLTCLTPGGTPGFLRVSAVSNGTSFTILSSSGTDTSVVSWMIVANL